MSGLTATLALAAVSPWVAVPLAAGLMFVVAGHVLSTHRAGFEMPASRRRIRTANGLIMLLVIPLLAHGVSSGPGTDQPQPMAFLWLLIVALLGLVIGLALLDVVNTLRLARRARADLRAALGTGSGWRGRAGGGGGEVRP